MEKARLIIDSPASGAWNMAVDQALLETADKTGQITLRFYRWSKPTLSLGYFQSHHDRVRHPASLSCPLVRRRTGGGAIVHDHELTYSLCIPSCNRWSKKNNQLYNTMHLLIIQELASRGIESHLFDEPLAPNVGRNDSLSVEDDNPFLCFLRRSTGDVIQDDFKIIGSAQRRIKNALLQHGSILCRRSDFAPELPGIEDLCAMRLSDQKLVENLSSRAEKALQIDLIPTELSKSEREAANNAHSLQFDSVEWNQHR